MRLHFFAMFFSSCTHGNFLNERWLFDVQMEAAANLQQYIFCFRCVVAGPFTLTGATALSGGWKKKEEAAAVGISSI